MAPGSTAIDDTLPDVIACCQVLPRQTAQRSSGQCRKAVAERLADANLSTPFQQPAGKGIGFYTGDDGFLYCDSQKIDDIREQVGLAESRQESGLV